tara:strand:- start:48 stop:248 length:201 start_codon:yes stop_codon:yes gene_type:complete
MVIGSLIGKVAQLAKRKRQISKATKRHSKIKKKLSKETAAQQRDRLEAGMTMSKQEKAAYLRKRRR